MIQSENLELLYYVCNRLNAKFGINNDLKFDVDTNKILIMQYQSELSLPEFFKIACHCGQYINYFQHFKI